MSAALGLPQPLSGEPPGLEHDAQGRVFGAFHAMASPWAVHIAGADEADLCRVMDAVYEDVRRLDLKFSSYQPDSITYRINRSYGMPVIVDAETSVILDYAADLWRSSSGLYDVTAGVLRRVWTFDGSSRIPSDESIRNLMPLVGWHRVIWSGRHIVLPAGMELDIGGIAKRYAMDRALALGRKLTGRPLLIVSDTDAAATAPPGADRPWKLGVHGGTADLAPVESLAQGCVSSCGDLKHYLMQNGRRLSPVLNPGSGYPLENAPRRVTVLGKSCSDAGARAALAQLHGGNAEAYLKNSGLTHWVDRGG